MVWVIVVIVILIGLALAAIWFYNNLVRLRNRVDNAWAQVEVQLKRRWDLIPNLVETVKGYAAHERNVLEAVTQARADALQARGVHDTQAAEAKVSAALADLRAVAENYPALRATENFQRLQADLTETEDEIQAARRIYNANARTYNTRIQIFPNSIVAGAGGFEAREYFEIETAAEREPVNVSFS